MAAIKLSICLLLCLIGAASGGSANKLRPDFYNLQCPLALQIIREEVTTALKKEPTMGLAFFSLHFTDCFVQGCDASILLKDTQNFTGEQSAVPDAGSTNGTDIIEKIKGRLEKLCPGVVSCADIVAVAARDSVVAQGGPSWNVRLGRRDSTTSNISAVSTDLPSPFMNLSQLLATFGKKNFTAKEMVAFTGVHTVGFIRCLFFRTRIYNESNIDPSYARSLQEKCPFVGGDDNLAPLDRSTPHQFDNAYYKNLLVKKGLLHSDQELYNGGSTDSIVEFYASNALLFRRDFANTAIKMGNFGPLTGTRGQIRTQCSKVN
ncbi:cationic peroxidase 1 [Vigna angularis]|uniref:cationic peroxidase 1 n=1 Tax=Phaseolus angularis TaxID=3914 RepID=UPI000809D609|nr:cationic peroxidase 1 [Vigna angularis]